MTVTPEIRDGLLRALPGLRAFAISLSGNTDRADDLVQDTITLAIARIHRFEPGTNLEAWLFTILRNQFYSHFRKTAREVEDPDGLHAARFCSLPEQEAKITHRDLLRALQKLRWDQREALLPIGAQGLSYEEAAKVAGVAEGTLKTRVRRARMNLAQLLDVTDSEDLGPGRRGWGATVVALRCA